MSVEQLRLQAFNEWNGSGRIKQQYHTFEFYWSERYARVYRLPNRVDSISGHQH